VAKIDIGVSPVLYTTSVLTEKINKSLMSIYGKKGIKKFWNGEEKVNEKKRGRSIANNNYLFLHNACVYSVVCLFGLSTS